MLCGQVFIIVLLGDKSGGGLKGELQLWQTNLG